MAVTPPAYYDIQNAVIADITTNLVIIDPTTGQQIMPNFSVGSVFLTLAEVIALVMDAFYGQLVQVDAALRLATAVGSDLDAIGALLGCSRLPGSYATVPVQFTRNQTSANQINIPTELGILALDIFGNPTIEFVTVQDPTQPLGVAGVVLPGATTGWALAEAVATGTGGNVGANQVVQIQGTPLAGVSSVGNPQVAQPAIPTVTVNNTAGTTTRQYAIVAHGLTGTTPLSPVGQTTTGNATPNDTISWASVPNAYSYDVLFNTGSTGSPVWQLLANVGSGTLTYTYTGQATTVYALPNGNTTNTGIGGSNSEPDDGNPGYRQRIPTVLQAAAKSTNPALVLAVGAISGVVKVFVSDGAAGVCNVYYVGSSNPLSAATISAIGTAISNTKAAGIQVVSSQITPTVVAVSYTFAAAAGQTAANLITPINQAITNYFNTLNLSAPVRWSQVAAAIAGVPGVAACNSITMVPAGGSTYTNQDVPAVNGVLYGAPTSYTVTFGS